MGSFVAGIFRATAVFSLGTPVLFSLRGGEAFLAIFTGAFDGWLGALVGVGADGLLLSAGGGGGSSETAMVSGGGRCRIEGFAHGKTTRRWSARDATKKRSSGVFKSATELYYCTTRMLSK
jgi:hypothetical protein